MRDPGERVDAFQNLRQEDLVLSLPLVGLGLPVVNLLMPLPLLMHHQLNSLSQRFVAFRKPFQPFVDSHPPIVYSGR